MANEAIVWPSPPDVTDTNDGTQAYNLGRDFTLTDDVPIVGVEWRVPDVLETPWGVGAPHAVALWDEATGTRLAYKEVTPMPGGVAQLLFDTPYAGVAGPVYTASVYTNHYAYRPGAAVGSTSPSGVVVAGDSQLIPHNTGPSSAPMPDVLSTANFYVSPIVDVGGGGAVQITSTLTGKWRVYQGVGSSLTGKWGVFSQITTTLTGKWRILQAITSSLTGKWQHTGGVVTTLTSKWRVFSRALSTLTGKWSVEGTPDPPPVVSSSYLQWQRTATANFIAQDPSTITLVPHQRVRTGNGGYVDQAGAPRVPQTVKLILLSNDQRPTTTVAGVERSIDYHLVGPWDMAIAVGDTWDDADGTTWEVLGFTEGWDYMTKAFVGRRVPRGGKA